MEPKESIKKVYSKKRIWLKTLIVGTAIGTTLYVGDSIDISHKAERAYVRAKSYVERIFTSEEKAPVVIVKEPKDLHEYSEKFIEKVFEEKEPEKYQRDFAKVMCVTSKVLPDSLAVVVINERVNDMNVDYKYDVMKHSVKKFLEGNKEGLETIMKDFYFEIKEMYKKDAK
ncbi:MAG: hypothetical protein KJ583_03250 [Nanoarchaeota archaeon]|nr:hypothetical protein [Nanoarchaeota archaeon]MBU1269394.1 hypothetical protein [Nanoarchaeota archaeon]MBU1604311.1 hypothetical protein [Nanoarchaeota archaeon]MBU2442892.1 hypothetical protein [Nanoarchaeota archaeon]